MDEMKHILAAALSPTSTGRALRVTAVVAPVLVGMNHATCVLDGTVGARCALHAALTALVPFLVSTYTSARAALEDERARRLERVVIPLPRRTGHG